ncbi:MULTISPECIES: class I SAM-dependent methyltransferase [Pelosinus]|uniref:Methyltransferase type 11 n=1 Tax=Pelosinus fermentans B4 TaxID=1149862 RepID=I8RAR0_9FIRM|nr:MULTISPECIES: class I SAM-dependent methyltransferase [Pelosinus]EIW16023.1 hypothetical protein FB4_1712 [Pelosinus fermentans B4]EIW27271.1 Methyltransferase type 11 [Pelosinus fermentans A11]
MAKLYGIEKNEKEIKEFVQEYVNRIKSNKYDRYHDIMSLVPTGKTILDYGCGWGHFSIAMQQCGNTVYAIDLFQNEIDICNLVWGKQENLIFDCENISGYNDKHFDCVLSNQVIEHVHNVGNYLLEINRVLKDNGDLIISLPNILNPRFFLSILSVNLEDRLKDHSKKILEKYDKAHDHINAWDPYHFVTLCSSLGFVLERYIPTEGIAFPFRKPFKPYVHLNNNRLRNWSYTMTFLFKKIKSINIDNND